MLTGIRGLYAGWQQRAMGVPWGWTIEFGALSVVAPAFAPLSPPVTLAAITDRRLRDRVGRCVVVGAFKLRSPIRL